MGTVSERLLALRPVTFRFKKSLVDGESPVQFGLIAEEVEEVFPELVVYDSEGRPKSVKYHLLSSLLLNELQKLAAAMADQAEISARQTRELSELAEMRRRLAELESLDTRRSTLEKPPQKVQPAGVPPNRPSASARSSPS